MISRQGPGRPWDGARAGGAGCFGVAAAAALPVALVAREAPVAACVDCVVGTTAGDVEAPLPVAGSSSRTHGSNSVTISIDGADDRDDQAPRHDRVASARRR